MKRGMKAWILGILVLVGSATLTYLILTGNPGRATVQRIQCNEKLMLIQQALMEYHSKHGSFPPAYVVGPDDTPMHSWRVLLLPYLGETALYNEFDLSQPWDSQQNMSLLDSRPDVFACPRNPRRDGMSSYVAIVGPNTCWPGSRGVRQDGVSDGFANTIILLELAQSNVPWIKPEDIQLDELTAQLKSNPVRFAAHGQSTVHVIYGDGFKELIDLNVPTSVERLRGRIIVNDRR